MTGIEVFSLCAWATPQLRDWNMRKGKGAIYRGWDNIADSERFFPNELKRKVAKPQEISTYGT